MKLLWFYLTGQDDTSLTIELQAETQEDANLLVHAANAMKKPVRSGGEISKTGTRAWFEIPLKKDDGTLTKIGNIYNK